MDPIVRVEARRLRTRLDEYYAGAGSADAVVIEFPKGSYAPAIRAAASAPAAKRMRWPWIASAAALILVAGAAYWALPARRASAVAVIPSHWMGEAHALSDFETGLAEAISAELARRGSPVIAFPSLLRYRRAAKRTRDIAAETGAREVLFVSASARGDGSHVVVHLVNAEADRKTWAADYVRGLGDPLEQKRELARIIAAELALRNR